MLYSTPLPYAADAGAYFAAIAELPWAIWLDSGGRARYDILAAQPIKTLLTHGTQTIISDVLGQRSHTDDPFELLRKELPFSADALPDLPFSGGALGYWGYDLSRRWIDLPACAPDTEHLPDMAVGIYDWSILIDHQEKTARLVSRLRAPETLSQLPGILARLQSEPAPRAEAFRIHAPPCGDFPRADYDAAFDKIHNYLIAGDCYQVNLTQRFTAQASGDALDAYLTLRKISPAPYSAFLNLPQVQILSTSPERFLSLYNKEVETKPIKGTRPRGVDAAQDEQLKTELLGNTKDRAENLMIVDLLRNDLSKSCLPGSVTVNKLFEIESYANVHHLVSTITGKLQPGKDALALLQNCFPGGSITGAPKKRAMEIIEQLETQRRGIYCGSIGYIGWDGNMDTNIAIRTMIYTRGEIHFSVGGGIVADSDCDAEYRETLDKAAAMFQLAMHYTPESARSTPPYK